MGIMLIRVVIWLRKLLFELKLHDQCDMFIRHNIKEKAH